MKETILEDVNELSPELAKKAKHKANPKWIALAGNPLNIPKLSKKGNGEAYHN